MSMYWLKSGFTLLMIAAAVPLFVAGCGGGEGHEPQVGDVLESTVSVKGVLVRTTTYKAYDLEPDDGKYAPVLLCETVTTHVTASPVSILPVDTDKDVTLSDVTTFLENHWDEHYGGIEDEGVNSFEFVEFLHDHNVDIHNFINQFRKANADGMSLAYFVGFVEDVCRVLRTDSIGGFFAFLDRTELSMKDVTDVLHTKQMTMDAFLEELNACSLSCDNLYNLYMQSGKHLGELMDSLYLNGEDKEASDTKPVGGISVDDGLKLANYCFSIFENGKPVGPSDGAKTSVLCGGDMDYTHYFGSTITNPPLIEFVSKWNGWGWEEYHVIISPEVKFNAQHRDVPGRYIPEISSSIADSSVSYGWTVSSKASFSDPVNISSDRNMLIPEVTMTINVDASMSIWSHHQSFKIMCYGDRIPDYVAHGTSTVIVP